MAEQANVQYIEDSNGKLTRYRDAGHDLEHAVFYGRPPTYHNYSLIFASSAAGSWRWQLYNNVPTTVLTVEKIFVTNVNTGTDPKTNTIWEFRKFNTVTMPATADGSIVASARVDTADPTWVYPAGPIVRAANAPSTNLGVPTSSELLWDYPLRFVQMTAIQTMSEWTMNQQYNLIPAGPRLTNLSLRYQQGLGIYQPSAVGVTAAATTNTTVTVVYTMEGE